MKTFRLFSMAAVALMMAACSSEDIMTQQEPAKQGGLVHFTATLAAPTDGVMRTAYTEVTSGTDAGTYNVSVKYVDTDGNYADLTGVTVPVTIASAAAAELTDDQMASAVGGLTYTGSSQALVTAPSSLPSGSEDAYPRATRSAPNA